MPYLAFIVIPPHPLRGVISYFIKIAPMVLRQPFIANGSVKTFDIGILLRFARLVVTTNHLRFATPLRNLFVLETALCLVSVAVLTDSKCLASQVF